MLASELKLLAKRRRTKVLVILLVLAPWLLGYLIFEFGGGGRGPNFVNLVSHNAVFLVLASLSSLMPLLLPLAVSLISADTIAGEASTGTLRYLLLAPVSRMGLLWGKLAASLLFTAVLCIAVAASSLLAGMAFFPAGRMLLLSGQTVTFGHGMLLAVLASGVVVVSLFSVVGIGLAISTFTDVPVGATLGTLGVVIISEILGNITQVQRIWPLLPTNYWASMADVFRYPLLFGQIEKDLLNQGVWLVFCFSLASARFLNKDITS